MNKLCTHCFLISVKRKSSMRACGKLYTRRRHLRLFHLTIYKPGFNDDVWFAKKICGSSLFSWLIVDKLLILSCSPPFCHHVVSLGSIFSIWENSLRTKLTDFSVFPTLVTEVFFRRRDFAALLLENLWHPGYAFPRITS